MKRILSLFIFAVFCGINATAQELDSKVEVTNDFRADAGEVEKYVVEMAVPDSLMSFNYKFNYSVFETPYNGSYEFSPYNVLLSPEKRLMRRKNFYFKAGAGYAAHPILKLYWTPLKKSRFTLDVQANGCGFLGNYIYPSYISGDRRFGYDLFSGAGVNGSWEIKDIRTGFSVQWRGFAAGESNTSSIFNLGKFGGYIESLRETGSFFYYRAAVIGTYGHDALFSSGFDTGNFRIDASVGAVLKSKYRFLVDVGVETENSAGQSLYSVGVTPCVLLNWNAVKIKAGVKLSSDTNHPFDFFPDVSADLDIAGGRFGLFASLTGGDRINSYESMKLRNHRFTPEFCSLSVTRTAYDLNIGFRGLLKDHFEFRLCGGYARVTDSPIESSRDAIQGKEGFYYADYRKAYASALATILFDYFSVEGRLEYAKAMFDGVPQVFQLPMFSGFAKVQYSLVNRLSFSSDVTFRTERSAFAGPDAEIPGWVDLGMEAEYRGISDWGFWGRIGNLLNDSIFFSPLYGERGVSLTVGVSYSF